jgi:hypothetical protein
MTTVFEEEEEEIKDLLTKEKKNPLKKRGRKPKGGKIIEKSLLIEERKEQKTNIILHLKCYSSDLTTSNGIDSLYTFSSCKTLPFQMIPPLEVNISSQQTSKEPLEDDFTKIESTTTTTNYNKMEMKEIYNKIKYLENNLHHNNNLEKKSACFWCTYDFTTLPIHIPKYFMKESYHVYGCFCSPECATSYLMNENLDSSTKFERYHILNHMYSKIYNYEKNIKPAPNPFYMLNKYYGNLTIQEYRALLKTDRLFFVMDKPFTRIMPEIHEDSDEFLINNDCNNNSNNNNNKKKEKQTKQTINNIEIGDPSPYSNAW